MHVRTCVCVCVCVCVYTHTCGPGQVLAAHGVVKSTEAVAEARVGHVLHLVEHAYDGVHKLV